MSAAITVNDVCKDFRLAHQQDSTLKSHFVSVLKRNNARTFETQHALKNISFEVKKGEFFGIVGRNGSGKSTLLKIIAGIYQPTKGSVDVSGRVVPFIELGVGFNGELTGRENVYLNGALLGFSEKEIQAKYNDITKFAELERFMDQKLKNYSSGMQVRLAFSVATRLAESDILIIDEVLAVGDASFQRKCFRYFKQLKKERKTVIFVTHDMNAVREYCDRAAFIEKSELVAVGAPEKISKMYERLLMPEQNSSGSEPNNSSRRWGDGVLKIKNAKIRKSDNQELIISMDVMATKDCDDPVFGFVIKNGAGIPIVGTNTILQRVHSKPMAKDERKTLDWQLINVLADGDYTVTLAAQYDSGITNGDWWEDACSLRVTRPAHTPYLIDPDIKIDIR